MAEKKEKKDKMKSSLIIELPDPKYETYFIEEGMEVVENKLKLNSHSHSSHSNSSSNSSSKYSSNYNESHNQTYHQNNHQNNENKNQEIETIPSSSVLTTSHGPIFHHNLPFVVLDCANIGWSFGDTSFSAIGLKFAYDYFNQFPLNVYGFIPSSYVRKKPTDGSRGNCLMETNEWEIMNNLVKSRHMSIVPAGDNDDLYILQFAQNNNGFIISNDFYLDHLQSIESFDEQEAAKNWLSYYRCSYTFVPQFEGNFTIMLNPTRYYSYYYLLN